MADPRDIWVGDWKAKFYETNRAFNGAGRMDDLEKKKWDTYYSVGHNIYKQIHPTSYIASDIISASSYYANLAILRDRQAVKDQATASSSASAGAAAAAAARAKKEYEEKQKALSERQKQIDASISSSSESAAKAAAARAKAEQTPGAAVIKANNDRIQGAKMDASISSSSASASRAASEAAKREAEYKKKLKADAAAEDLAVKNANLEALIKQQQGTIDALQQQAASNGTVYYSASSDNGASMDNNNLTLEPVAVQGTNLRNSLLLVGGVALVWWFFKKKKKRAR
jgi:hypothetical protein